MSCPMAAKKKAVNIDALRSEIRVALIGDKANACPIASRLVRYNMFECVFFFKIIFFLHRILPLRRILPLEIGFVGG